MSQKREKEGYISIEKQNLTRLILLVLSILGIASICCVIFLPKVAWVLIICFFYLLALEAVFLASD
ncbi:MAG: hypothetical protein ACFFD8_09595 [Candidatus Thorarchaeota archaeon]